MSADRQPANDPRTIARDIPGIIDGLFPQLIPGVVAHFNRKAYATTVCSPVPQSLVDASTLQRAMLFELAVAAAELLITGKAVDWAICLDTAMMRQRRHFDAKVPESLSNADTDAAMAVATNLARMLELVQKQSQQGAIVRAPAIPGYQWIASGVGDFAVKTQLIEVKCTNKRFSSSDYRQVLMYWLLSYAAALEENTPEWTDAILLNPRLNLALRLPFHEVINVTSAGRSKVELVEHFASMVGERAARASSSG